MRLRIIAVGMRMPAWVEAGVQEYVRRLPRELPLSIEEVKPAAHRDDADVAMADEGQRVLQRAGALPRTNTQP